MKKYLIKGLLALVVGGFTASCADKDGEYVPMDQQKEAAYAEVFKELIGGEVAPNHDWGFTKTSIVSETSESRAMTRATTYMNGNMEKYENAPTVGATEEADVEAYVHTLQVLPAKAAPDWDTYFVTQIHEGKASYNTQKSIDKSVEYVAGNQMDELAFAMQAGAVIKVDGTLEGDWIHINNFNSANNTDWNGNTLVENGGTVDFAYKSTADSKYHNRWIGIDGADIDDKYKDYYYICFDFEATGDQNTSTVIKWRDANNTPLQANIPGGWTDLSQVMGKTFTYDFYEWQTGNTVKKTLTVGEEGTSSWELDNVVGGNKVVKGNNDFTDWIVRLYKAKSIGGDDVTGGETSTTTTTRTDRVERSRLVAQGRVFCEDLGTDAARMLTSDIDFNDAVFDAKIWRKGQFDIEYKDNTYSKESDYLENIYTTGINGFDIETTGGDAHVIVNGKFKYVAEICILAAGGTIPLKIGGNYGFEIHEEFGVGHTTVVNTMGDPSIEQFKAMINHTTHDAVTINVDITDIVRNEVENNNTDISLDIIPVEVQWKNGEYRGIKVLKATSEEDIHNAPQKLCVSIGTPWVYERIPITKAYANFASYATSKKPKFWEGSTNRNPSLLYPSIKGEMVALEGETGNVNTNPKDDKIVIPGTTTTTTVVETVLWEGEMTFGASDANQTIKLYSTTFDAGNDIRIYGSSNGGLLTLQNSDSQNIISPSLNFSNVGYADSSVDENQAGQLSSGASIIVVASNCTITKICKVVTTTN